MKLTNQTYDRLKWIALVFLPAFEALVLTLGKIWGFPYYVEIGATAAAFGVFLAALLGVSSKNYYDDLKSLENEDEDPEEPERSLPEERYDVD